MNTVFSAWFPRITVHSLAIVASLLIYILTTRAERERRPPAVAIAWVLGLVAVPYMVLPLYVLFGRRKLLRKASQRKLPTHPSPHWAQILIASFGLEPAAAGRTRWHANGESARTALWDLFDRAQQRLDVCTYILGNDAFGREVAARLAARAAAGVRVRLMIDGVGALSVSRALWRQLRRQGIETATFSPLLARSTGGPRNLRNHRKLAIADAAALWAGGRNLADEYFCGQGGTPPWIDLSFDVEGAVAAAAALQFESDWVDSGGAPAAPLAAPADLSSDLAQQTVTGRVQFLPSGPDQSEDTVHALLIDACFRAESRLLAITPYFVPDAALATAMRLAAHRGVKIDLCMPANSNHVLADFARSRGLRALADAGAGIHLLSGMVHAKAFVFDRTLAISGSPNLDSRSLLLNYESAFVFYGPQDIDWVAAWIESFLPAAVPFDNRAPGLWRDLSEGLLLSVAYQL